MLAFFMIAGQIQKSDAVSLETPISESDSDRQINPLNVSITKDELILVNGVVVPLDDLVTRIRSLLEDYPAQSPNVLVRADARLPANRTRAILGVLRESGLQEVALATLQTADSTN